MLISVTAEAAGSGYATSNAFPGVSFTNPVAVVSPPGETNRLFIVEKKGRIVVITNLAAPTRTIFMDISSSSTVISSSDTSIGSEEGLLGLAFHPGYATNRYFYVFYTGTKTTVPGTGRHDVLSRFEISPADTNQGLPGSEAPFIIQWDQANNHNAGDLHFGPDGYLYVSLGDEGGAYGSFGNSQKITNDFFSAIMRLDVDIRQGSLPPNPHPSALPSLTNYSIPSDNPYVGASSFNGYPIVDTNRIRTEFWAVGMRNPWRFSFDPVSGDLLLGHVGQDNVEWVNVVTKGANCGWNFYEGNLQFTNTLALPPGFAPTFVRPLTQYTHTTARKCIIGGVVYRGLSIPQLYGAYLYAEYVSGEIWTLRYAGTNVTLNTPIITNTFAWTCFGVDPANGDVLIGAARGGTNSTIERLYSTNPTGPLAPGIAGLSQLGSNIVVNTTGGVPGGSFYLVSTSTLLSPLASWPSVATGAYNSSGSGSVSNAWNPSLTNRFYKVKLP
jgi:glucose/arabinose dehydrogenase